MLALSLLAVGCGGGSGGANATGAPITAAPRAADMSRLTSVTGSAVIDVSPDGGRTTTLEVPVDTCADTGNGTFTLSGTDAEGNGFRVVGGGNTAAIKVFSSKGVPLAGADGVTVTRGGAVAYDGANQGGVDPGSLKPVGGTFSITVGCTPAPPKG